MIKIDNNNPATWPVIQTGEYYRLVNHASRYATAGFLSSAAVEHYREAFHSPSVFTAHIAMRERYNELFPSSSAAVLGNALTARHLYEVDTTAGRIDVHAHNRRIAQGYAVKAGYEVKSVNMVG